MTDKELATALLQAGWLQHEHVKYAGSLRTPEKRFAQVIVDLGWMQPADILAFDPHALTPLGAPGVSAAPGVPAAPGAPVQQPPTAAPAARQQPAPFWQPDPAAAAHGAAAPGSAPSAQAASGEARPARPHESWMPDQGPKLTLSEPSTSVFGAIGVLVIMLLSSLLVAKGTQALEAEAKGIHIIGITYAMVGLVLAIPLASSVHLRVRHAPVIWSIAVAGVLTTCTAIHYFDYLELPKTLARQYEVSTADARMAADEYIKEETGQSGFIGFLKLEMQETSVGKLGTKDPVRRQSGAGAAIFYGLIDLVAMGGACLAMSTLFVALPFCPTCQKPSHGRMMGATPSGRPTQEVVGLLRSGRLHALHEWLVPLDPGDEQCRLMLEECRKCHATGAIVRVWQPRKKPPVRSASGALAESMANSVNKRFVDPEKQVAGVMTHTEIYARRLTNAEARLLEQGVRPPTG